MFFASVGWVQICKTHSRSKSEVLLFKVFKLIDNINEEYAHIIST